MENLCRYSEDDTLQILENEGKCKLDKFILHYQISMRRLIGLGLDIQRRSSRRRAWRRTKR